MSDISAKENIPPPPPTTSAIAVEFPSLRSVIDKNHTENHHSSSTSSSSRSSSSEEPSTPIPTTIESTSPLADLEKQKPPVLKEGTRWCQRCGSIETPRWRYGPAGPLTLCNACHLRWKTQGKPSSGYSSTTFPPPHYSPSCLKRKKILKVNETNLKRVKQEDQDLKLVHLVSKKLKVSNSPPPPPLLSSSPSIPPPPPPPSPPLPVAIPTIIPGTCTSCHCTTTPLWRKGPLGPKTLCNACGLKWAKEADKKVKTPPVAVTTANHAKTSITTTANTSVSVAKPTNAQRKASSHTLLHNQKQFIKHGLYSDELRLVNPRPKSPFVFELPIHLGACFFEKPKDFELPADILQERELGLIKGLRSDRQPSFTRIRSNIFVERKPVATNGEPVVCHCQRPTDPEEAGCGDDCINRMLFYECDPKYCPCGDQCSNQRFQRRERKKELQIFQTENRGWGLRTLVDIKKDELVIEYRGEIISHQLCEERMCTIYVNEKNFYFLDYCNGEVIDACYKGTEARFINHSCDPNCHIEKWSLRGESHFGVFASTDIQANSELFYDYNFSTFNDSVESQQPCYCGTAKCRGTIGRKASSNNKK